ncbi:unnamed protein product, partial [Ectocarpus sp. 12 AP-2014]
VDDAPSFVEKGASSLLLTLKRQTFWTCMPRLGIQRVAFHHLSPFSCFACGPLHLLGLEILHVAVSREPRVSFSHQANGMPGGIHGGNYPLTTLLLERLFLPKIAQAPPAKHVVGDVFWGGDARESKGASWQGQKEKDIMSWGGRTVQFSENQVSTTTPSRWHAG